MTSVSAWLVALGPLGLMGISMFSASRRSLHIRHLLARSLSAISLLSALAVLFCTGIDKTIRAPLLGVDGIGFSLHLDTVSASMFALVSFIGLIVIAYCRNYLSGDPGEVRFMKWISLTLGSVLMMIVSGNLFQFFVFWVSTSLCLHQLLTFFSERPAAVLAARKKWVVSRIGDLCLLIALNLIHRHVGSLEYSAIFDYARAAHGAGQALAGVAPLLALAGLLKSAQFPVHGWLLEVMETPTPVSALLHAGIINSGGFLLIRFSPLLVSSPLAMNGLLIIGAVTATFGSLVMLTQSSVKVSLAYSTIAQMGFMMLECGLGVFSAAMLHIIAHSLYKAHAFLSSGEAAKTVRPQAPSNSWLASGLGALAAIAAVMGVGALLGASFWMKPGTSTLSYIFALGAAALLSCGIENRLKLSRIFVYVGFIVVLFYGLQRLAEGAFASHLTAESGDLSAMGLGLRFAIILIFAALMILQRALPNRWEEGRWLALYAHLANGFYVNTLANRLAIRFWPSPAPRSALPSYIPKFQKRGES